MSGRLDVLRILVASPPHLAQGLGQGVAYTAPCAFAFNAEFANAS